MMNKKVYRQRVIISIKRSLPQNALLFNYSSRLINITKTHLFRKNYWGQFIYPLHPSRQSKRFGKKSSMQFSLLTFKAQELTFQFVK